MRKSAIQLLFFLFLVKTTLFTISCSTDEGITDDDGPVIPVDPCDNGPTLSIAKFQHTVVGESNGIIEIESSQGNGVVEFSINGGDSGAATTFNGLGAGTYTILAVDDSLCNASVEFEIKALENVSFQSDIKPIIDASCRIAECHGTNPSIPSWENYDIIKQSADRIKAEVVSRRMPAEGTLSDEQIALIRDWVDLGAPNN